MWTKVRRVWRRLCGWRDCPICGEQALRWVKIPILFEDEPPMLCKWACFACGAETGVTGTPISDQAAKELGYPDFVTALGLFK